MVRPPTFAALCLVLISAATASAEASAQSNGRGSQGKVRFRVGPEISANGPGAARSLSETGLFSGTRPGLGLSQQTYREEDGSAIVRNGLIGSLPVSPGVNAGLGIFSVTHEDQKELEFRRGWSAKDIGPRNRKVAAVGLNVRF